MPSPGIAKCVFLFTGELWLKAGLGRGRAMGFGHGPDASGWPKKVSREPQPWVTAALWLLSGMVGVAATACRGPQFQGLYPN